MPDVLVLEDDELVLDMTVQALEDAGYAVQMAENGPEALRILEGGQPFQMIVADINLGEPMNGFQVVERARAARPNLKVIFYSGIPANWNGRAFDEDVRHLDKPFHLDALLKAMADLKVWPSQPPVPGQRATF